MTISVTVAPSGGNSLIYKINVNGVDSGGMTLTLSDANLSAVATGSVSVSAGDLVCISVSSTGTPSLSTAVFTVRYD